jgi:hypothetical protein
LFCNIFVLHFLGFFQRALLLRFFFIFDNLIKLRVVKLVKDIFEACDLPACEKQATQTTI